MLTTVAADAQKGRLFFGGGGKEKLTSRSGERPALLLASATGTARARALVL